MKHALERHWRVMMVVVAALFSIVVMVVLALANADLVRELKSNRARGTTVPVAGALAGWKAPGGSEWLPEIGGGRPGILFAVLDTAGVGSAQFWREMVARLGVLAPETQFVGFCVSRRSCAMPLEVEGSLTMLEAMDPALMHTLKTAARDGRVFMFREAEIVGGMQLTADWEMSARQIANFVRRPAIGGGA